MKKQIEDIEVGDWVFCASLFEGKAFTAPAKVRAVEGDTITVDPGAGYVLRQRHQIKAVFSTKEEALNLHEFETTCWRVRTQKMRELQLGYEMAVSSYLENPEGKPDGQESKTSGSKAVLLALLKPLT